MHNQTKTAVPRTRPAVRFSRWTGIGLGLIVLTVAGLFLLNMDWGRWWPLMIISPGLALTLNRFVVHERGPVLTAMFNLCGWFGVMIILVGLIFLVDQLHLLSVDTFLSDTRWWGLLPLIPAVGALWNARWLSCRPVNQGRGGVWLLLLVSGVCLVTAVFELLGLSWTNLDNVLALMFLAAGSLLLLDGWRQDGD